MISLALVFLSSVTAASPTTPLPWFTNDDYPDQAFVRRQQGTTVFEVAVSPDGKAIDCKIDKSSGHAVLDRRACQVAMRTARFTPALGSDGRPTYGVYRTRVNWALDPYNWTQMEVGPDLEVNLSKLPEGTVQPVEVKFAYQVDSSGNASSCTAIGPTHPKVLDAMGCQELLNKAPRAPLAISGSGTVPVVRTAWVRFAPTD